MKTSLIFTAIAAITMASTASAQEQTETRTVERPNTTTSTTTTVDREAGSIARDRSITNKNTGNTASSTLDRQRTDTGSVVSRSQTGPAGNTRSFDGERVRTENGATFDGTATGRGGNSYGVSSARSRDGQGNSSASQRVTNNQNGNTIYSRDRTTTRSDGRVNRNVETSRRQGAKRPSRARGRRPR